MVGMLPGLGSQSERVIVAGGVEVGRKHAPAQHSAS